MQDSLTTKLAVRIGLLEIQNANLQAQVEDLKRQVSQKNTKKS